MPLVTPNAGELVLLGYMLKDTTPTSSLTLKLFKNDYTPDQSSTNASFTEADFTGYSSKTLSRSSWGSPATVSNKASSTYGSAQTWTATSSQTVYGYYVLDGTTVLWAERFASARALQNGDTLSVTPVMTLNSEN